LSVEQDKQMRSHFVNIKGAAGDRIDGGAVRGSSLFHSFSEFNVNDGQRVYLETPLGLPTSLAVSLARMFLIFWGRWGLRVERILFLLNPEWYPVWAECSARYSGFVFGNHSESLCLSQWH
jgi:hypothetical protein